MKIVILGPVVTNSYFGGVATFDEGLAKGLKSIGVEVILTTTQKDAKEQNEEILIKIVNRKSFKTLVESFQPDYIISELAYAKYFMFLNTSAKKIYYLHAFFKQSYYGVIKSKLAVFYQKQMIKHSDLVISNSHFTAMVNREFYGINSNAICEVGLKDDFCQKIDSQYKDVLKEKNSIFFAARLVPAKGANLVIEAARKLIEKGIKCHLYIAGDGPEREKLLSHVSNSNLPITFLGRLDHDQMIAQYAKSEVFISLDRSEPYGIVFLEALVAGCKIVCPVTGGQMEILKDYREYTSYVDVNSINSIADGIQNALESQNNPCLSEEEKNSFTYSAVANKLLNILENKKN